MSSEKNSLKDLAGRLLNPRSRLEEADGFSKAVERSLAAELGESSSTEMPAYSRGGPPLKAILTNTPLMVGLIVVLFLFGLVMFGPVLAPQNPYIAGQRIVPHFDRELGEYIRPPLEPSSEYPLGTDQWGADILSLLMHGARNTLVAGAFITMLRVILGVVLGAAAGWNEGKYPDRIVMGLLGLITSLPMLIVAIILIYALDIRRGLLVFIIALSIIGWTEIAQYVRGEILVLRKMPYIEGARATGLTNVQIIVRHILPNVLPYLLVITFLEMGAVLMLLGELGFVGVYIGGGSRIDLTEPLGPPAIFTLPDVPEWGAMIADGFRWLRSKPFVVMPPAVAFFIAVAGFNLFGEGLRRLIERYSVNTGFLLQKRMLVFVGGLTLATVFIMNNTGAAPWFARVAAAFSGDTVFEHVQELAGMDGRSVAQEGGQEAATYIADKFAEYGLQPGWRRSSYYYLFDTQLVQPLEQPELELVGEDGQAAEEFKHQIDFGYLIEGHGGSGEVTAPLTFVGFDDRVATISWDDYAGLDFRGRIVLVQRGDAPFDFPTEAMIRGAKGVIWIGRNENDPIRSQIQLAEPEGDYLRAPNIPIFRVRPSVAEQLVASSGWTLDRLLGDSPAQGNGKVWYTYDLDSQVHMSLDLSEPESVQVPSVIGYIPGSDLDLADEVVVLFTYYDGLGTDPDGTVYPAVNHDATGVAMLLELARLWQEQDLDTRRTTMFVAWGGAELDQSGASAWISDPFNFRHIRSQAARGNVSPRILLQLDYVGAGGEQIVAESHSRSDRLADLIEETAGETEAPLAEQTDDLNLGTDIVWSGVGSYALLGWQDANVSPTEDTLDKIDLEKLQQYGELFALVLTKLARETQY
ncbi:MAG: ABC transporter permease subunit [Candidatus Promineifilaceae bacterium]